MVKVGILMFLFMIGTNSESGTVIFFVILSGIVFRQHSLTSCKPMSLILRRKSPLRHNHTNEIMNIHSLHLHSVNVPYAYQIGSETLKWNCTQYNFYVTYMYYLVFAKG